MSDFRIPAPPHLTPQRSVDLDVLREKNRELSNRVQELDLELFQLLTKPLQKNLTNQLPIKQRRMKSIPSRVEPGDDQFEDAKEEASQITATDSEDKHSNAAWADHELDSHSDFRDLHPQDEAVSSPSSQQQSSDMNMKNLISLYETQFEKMKVIILLFLSFTLPLE